MVDVVIVGAGIAGRARSRAVHAHESARLVGVHHGRFAEDLGAPVFDDGDAALAAADVVIVSSPSETHADWVRRALDADRDVIVEYPLARTAEEASALLARARAGGRTLHVEHIERLSATTRWMSDEVETHGWTGASLHFASRGAPYADGPDHAWHNLSRLHRIVAALGWPDTIETVSATGDRLDAILHHPGDRRVAFVAERGRDLERGLTWTVEGHGGPRHVRGRSAFLGDDPVELPPTSLFAEDLDRALRRRRGEPAGYVTDTQIVALLAASEHLGVPGRHGVSSSPGDVGGDSP